jgi:carboxymethylenebutenolidase
MNQFGYLLGFAPAIVALAVPDVIISLNRLLAAGPKVHRDWLAPPAGWAMTCFPSVAHPSHAPCFPPPTHPVYRTAHPGNGEVSNMDDFTEAAGLRDYPLARRGLMMTSLISGFTLAIQRVEAQTITTDTTGLVAGETRIPATGGDLPAYYARPEKGSNFPIVIVNEEIFGVHEHIKDLCRRLAKAGYLAVATEYYARIGDLSKMTDVPTIISTVITKAPDAQYLSDVDSTITWAGKNKGSVAHVAVTGFCRGGRQTWLIAENNKRIKAAVAWYGPVLNPTSDIQPKTATDGADQLKCPLLGLYGGQDTSIKVDDVHAAQAKAKAAGKVVDIVVYPDAPHGFNADYRPSFRKDAAEDGWHRMLAWFAANGVKPAKMA